MQSENQKPLRLSQDGLSKLTVREGLRRYNYNDEGGNCTYGVGTLVHYGPCSKDEDHKPVSNGKIQSSLLERAQTAERDVRGHIGNARLTQEQFDAQVSFIYNTGLNSDTAGVLNLAKEGQIDQIGQRFRICGHHHQG